MPTPIGSPKFVPGLHQFLCKYRVKIFLEIAFVGDQHPELARFPSVLHRIKCRVVKKTVNMPVWIAQPTDRSGIAMDEL